MSDPHLLHKATLTRLRDANEHVAVFDGDVPTSPPADSNGFVLPYLVLWGGGGVHAREALNATGIADPNDLRYSPRVTAVGGTVDRCLQAVGIARRALLGWRPDSSSGAFLEVNLAVDVQVDRDTSPARFYVPLQFTTLTA